MTKREDAQEAKLLAAEEAARAAREITEEDIRRAESDDEKACVTHDKALGALLAWRNDGPAPRGHKPGALGNGAYWCNRCNKAVKGFSAFQEDTCKGKRGARHPRPEKGTK